MLNVFRVKMTRGKDEGPKGQNLHAKNRSNVSPPSQATIMVFQAVAEYRIKVKDIKLLELEMTIQVEGSQQPIVWRFSKEDSHLAQTTKVSGKRVCTLPF